MSGNQRRRYDFAIKAQAAELFTKGYGCHSTATRLGLPSTTVEKWHHAYIVLGIEGLANMGKKPKRYLWETKAAAAKAVVEDRELKADVMVRYGIASLSSLEKWCKAYREGGEDALKPKPKGRPEGSVSPPRPKTHEEELERRIRKLEAENAYLKKSIALKAEKRLRTMRKP